MKKYIFLVTAAVLLLSGCKSWLDINRSPNNAEKDLITSDYLLSACQYDIANNHVNSTNAMMISHHLTKSGEYSGNYTYLNGLIMPQNQDSWWTTYYQILSNLGVIYEKAVQEDNDIYKGISLTLTVLNYQRLVDIFGNVPYSQACKPLEFSQPEYDDAATIYNDLLVKMDEAITCLERAASLNVIDPVLKKADIMCSGQPKQWLKFAYTIKLRVLMRMSNVKENEVKEQIAAIADKCLDIDEVIETNPGYYAEANKMNIFYQVYGWTINNAETTNRKQYMPTSELVDMLRNNNDPRLRVFIDPRTSLGDAPDGNSKYSKYGLENEYYVGIPYGQISPSRKQYTALTGTGLLAGGADKANGRLRGSTLITGAEVGFLLAEAALRGIIPGGDPAAKAYYEAAVIASMKRHETAMKDPTEKYGIKGMRDPISGTAEEAARAFLDQDNDFVNWTKMSSAERKMEAICSQKWLNFVGYNPLESWFEQRRTDYPLLKASNQGQKNKNVCRLPYPQTERNLNEPNVSKQPEVDVYESLVFWDLVNPLVEKTELYL